ncbi:MAG: hypothetical protein HOC23_16060 [Halieaceae bacterium]|nr:hypothetical protein [Halieaceae bacterium]
MNTLAVSFDSAFDMGTSDFQIEIIPQKIYFKYILIDDAQVADFGGADPGVNASVADVALNI